MNAIKRRLPFISIGIHDSIRFNGFLRQFTERAISIEFSLQTIDYLPSKMFERGKQNSCVAIDLDVCGPFCLFIYSRKMLFNLSMPKMLSNANSCEKVKYVQFQMNSSFTTLRSVKYPVLMLVRQRNSMEGQKNVRE